MNRVELGLGRSDLRDLRRGQHVANRDRVLDLLVRHLVLKLRDGRNRAGHVAGSYRTARQELGADRFLGGFKLLAFSLARSTARLEDGVNLLLLRISQVGRPQQQWKREAEHVHAAVAAKTVMPHVTARLALIR